jgi:hypothetical protein
MLYVLLLGWAPVVLGQQLVLGPYLQKATPTSVTICWETDKPASGVAWGMSGDKYVAVRSTGVARRHELELTGLKPGIPLYWQVGATPEKPLLPAEGTYHPLVPAGQPARISFVAMGDMGNGSKGQQQVARRLDSLAQWDLIDFWIPLGDQAYLLGSNKDYRKRFFPYYVTTMGAVPTYPIPGNHDYYSGKGKPYYRFFVLPTAGEAGGVPSSTEHFYSFDHGQVHFVMLNSEERRQIADSTSPMRRWLEADLKATRAKWKIVCWHQPPYTKGSHDSDDPKDMNSALTRQHLVAVVERHGADLVLHGHSHGYERSKLIRNHTGPSSTWNSELMQYDGGTGGATQPYLKRQADSPGTVYCVVGNGGKLSPGHALNHPVMVSCQDSAQGMLRVDISGDTLFARHITRSGAVVDSFYLVKPYSTLPEPEILTRIDFRLTGPGQWQVNYEQRKLGRPLVALYDGRGRRPYTLTGFPDVSQSGKYTFNVTADARKMPRGRVWVRVELDGKVEWLPSSVD